MRLKYFKFFKNRLNSWLFSILIKNVVSDCPKDQYDYSSNIKGIARKIESKEGSRNNHIKKNIQKHKVLYTLSYLATAFIFLKICEY